MDLGIRGIENATQIGSGGSAVVYQALQTDLGRNVAIKVLSSADEDFVRRFKREARTLGKLSQNPGIVTVYDFGETATGQPYLVLELCSSSLLEQVKVSGTLEPRHACAALADVSDAVGDAHDIGVVHRDIKPGNILISPTGRYLITDFGISTVSGATLGETSTVGFTAGYAAPETFQSEESGPSTDVYAIGATLFHLLSGNPPFINSSGDSNLLAVLHRVSTQPVLDLRPQGIPDPVCQVIESCMAKNVADRPTVLQVAAQLRNINKTGELAFPLPVPSANSNAAIWGEPSKTNTDSTRSMTQVMGTDHSQVTGSPSPQGSQTIPNTLSGQEERYARRSEPEQNQNSRAMAVILMVAAVTLLGGIIAATLLSRGNDVTNVAPATESSENSDDVASPVEGSTEGDGEDPNAPSTDVNDAQPVAINIMPNVVSASEQQAEIELDANGLRFDVEYSSSTSVPKGTVISSVPVAGSETPSATVVLLLVSSGTETFAVDDVVGSSEAAAVAKLSASGFDTGVITESSDSTNEGFVIRTEPAAGSRLGNGANVSIIISSGPQVCTGSEVPDVVGRSEKVATNRLNNSGLKVTVTEKYSQSVSAGNVISSTPPASTCAEADSTISLIVSCQAATVPDLIGEDGSDLGALTKAGFTATKTEVESSSVADGRVVSTTPAADTTACTSTPVTVAISSATTVCSVVVPWLRGQTPTAASNALDTKNLSATFEVVASPTVDTGLVITTSPAAGTNVCADSSVTVEVSSGPACVEVALPNAVGNDLALAMIVLREFDTTIVRQDDDAPLDQVVGTTPAAGTLVCPGATVSVLVSDGEDLPTTTENPNLVAVPDVVELPYADAISVLTAAGFAMTDKQDQETTTASQIGLVLSQSPLPGRDHDPADREVILRVGVAAE